MKKKPTKKDIEIVLSNVIQNLEQVNMRLNAIDNIFGAYIKYKKDDKSFQGYIQKQADTVSDDRDN